MGFMHEFPHSRMFDSDLREILELYLTVKDLPKTWETYKQMLDTEFAELKAFVNDYFDNLNVQNEINKKLDSMVKDGTMSNIIRHIFNYITPEMFGAVGNGVDDDTQAFQNAINHATSSIPYLKIKLSNKKYLVSSLNLKSGTKIIGENSNSVTQKHGCIYFTGDIALIYDDYIEDVIFENITLVGNTENTLVNNGVNQFKFSKFQNVDINSFRVAFEEIVLFVSTWSNVNINYCQSFGKIRGADNFISTGFWGLSADGADYGIEFNLINSIIENLYFTFCTKESLGAEYAIFFNECNNITLSKCMLTQSKNGFTYNNSVVSFTDCMFIAIAKYGDADIPILNDFTGSPKVSFTNIIYSEPESMEFVSGGTAAAFIFVHGAINRNKTLFSIDNYSGIFNNDNPFSFLKTYKIGTTNGAVSYQKSFINVLELSGYDSDITGLSLNPEFDLNGFEILVYANGTGTSYSFMGIEIQNKTMRKFKYINDAWVAIT